MTIPCRLLPFEDSDGAAHMAADEVMLLSAADHQLASLRFYTWNAATLSLGYFQAAACRYTTTSLAKLPFVRRATGGGAIVHHHELTYAIALPPGLPWQTNESWLCRMHHAIGNAFAKLGHTLRPLVCGEEAKLGEVLCFQHHTPGDLRIGVEKVVGSAQRKVRGALLQHGSILLSRSEFAPELAGIAELSGKACSPSKAAEAILGELHETLRWEFTPGDWTNDERAQLESLRRDKYTSVEWNEKR